MLVINKLAKPGGIKKIVLQNNEIVVTTHDGNTILYKRVEIIQ